MTTPNGSGSDLAALLVAENVSADEVRAIVAELDDTEALALLYDWSMWARPEQLPPAGIWRTWLIQAGRGFGKTRTGAETVRAWADDPNAQIALVGPTSADCRDVMIEGESGLMNVFPPAERPLYQPSKRRVQFKSGAVAFTYSAEEPERLRGPQHSGAWCLAGETLVLMADGTEKPIRDVRIGDRVQARSGASTVIGAALTRRNAEVFQLGTVGRRAIIGTSDHPVWTDTRGFVPLASLVPGVPLCASNVLNGTAICGIATATAIMPAKSDCIARSGKRRMDGFRRGTRSITSTATRPTTDSKIWNCYRILNTAGSICRTRSPQTTASAGKRQQQRRWRENAPKTYAGRWYAPDAGADIIAPGFIPPPTVHPGVWKPQDRAHSPANTASVRTVEASIRRLGESNCIAPKPVIRERLPIVRHLARSAWSSVTSAASGLRQSESTRDSAHASALWCFTERTAFVRRLAQRVDVYDIAVEAGEFFANGILVHNCDEIAVYPLPKELWDNLQFGLRLGADPRIVATTTPRPLQWLKQLAADHMTRVTRGATRDNAVNLPASTLAEFERVYGGTRIGRQELLGELLEEADGALWTRDAIERARVREAPELIRVVVAIDPSTTAGENSDECGIVAAGLGADGDGYVLSDRSGIFTPDQWAYRSVSLFDDLDADKIIAEVNNGGDLVESVIRTVRRNVSYEKVHASRGKVARAEPVAALYEQGRVHHVGGFAALEDEMTSFVPGGLTKSPNRADALVWALTALMVGKGRKTGRVAFL